jgi:cyclophilin family peptidyl-prolyl cis-trans isomerase
MRRTQKVFAILAFSALLTAGCGHSDTDPATASINGPGDPALNLPPVVLMKTSLGEVTLELDPEHAPLTVDNFLGYVERGHYEGTIFHDVQRGFMVLGGGYDAKLAEKPLGPAVRNEADHAAKNLRGSIAMARPVDVIDGAASQFFVNLADHPRLDHQSRTPEEYGYCVFGHVTKGLEIFDQMGEVAVRQTDDFGNLPSEPIRIESMRRVR